MTAQRSAGMLKLLVAEVMVIVRTTAGVAGREAEGDPVALLRAPSADDVLKALAGQPSGKHAA